MRVRRLIARDIDVLTRLPRTRSHTASRCHLAQDNASSANVAQHAVAHLVSCISFMDGTLPRHSPPLSGKRDKPDRLLMPLHFPRSRQAFWRAQMPLVLALLARAPVDLDGANDGSAGKRF